MRIISGAKPSGKLHIGNYLGSIKNWVKLQEDPKNECWFFIADYHSITEDYDPKQKSKEIFDMALDLLALGLGPKKSVLFQQSRINEHANLGWIFNTIVRMSELERMTQYKDKALVQKQNVNVGLFDYPALMAADILLYGTEAVPVGQDQTQHLELARTLAKKFNLKFGETFKEPKEMILKGVGVVPGTDGQKMSKSYHNTIPLFGTRDEIVKAVMSIVTDSKGESPENVYNIHLLLRSRGELSELYKANRGNYKALKEALIEDIEKLVAPMREKRASILDADVKTILKEGSAKAREQAEKKMHDVKRKVGVTL